MMPLPGSCACATTPYSDRERQRFCQLAEGNALRMLPPWPTWPRFGPDSMPCLICALCRRCRRQRVHGLLTHRQMLAGIKAFCGGCRYRLGGRCHHRPEGACRWASAGGLYRGRHSDLDSDSIVDIDPSASASAPVARLRRGRSLHRRGTGSRQVDRLAGAVRTCPGGNGGLQFEAGAASCAGLGAIRPRRCPSPVGWRAGDRAAERARLHAIRTMEAPRAAPYRIARGGRAG